ncbi:MAG: aminotransferase class III-fold pyridoxal phosphate-dependent enzyme [Flavobacteriales bacterium]|nr:aminotransferase class III-fold pyridoxal phosphate-dependent enzyme [Flavobacteriales bacterium]MCB9363371.1 aminotransferase class III-fold pyridoxal phosphate-dependent enzyme [Flavobacteriales bacterium]
MELFDVYPRFNVTPEKAQGATIYDTNGEMYLDMYGGHGVISVGHQHPDYVVALEQQLKKISFYSNSVLMPLQEELASKLGKVSGYENHLLFLCNSGAEANENALKVASFFNRKKKVIAFKNSFHGRTGAALNITDNPSLSSALNQQNFPVEFVSLNNEQAFLAVADHTVSSVIVEGIQGVGGLDYPNDEFLVFLKKWCDKNDALLILDEIQSGFGRTGKFFAHQHSSIEADIVTVAKGMGNGFPVAGLLIHPKIKASYGMLGTTFGGNYLACTAAIAVIDIIEKEKLITNATQLGNHLSKELSLISSIKKVKGKGLMMGVEFDFPIKELRNKLLSNSKIFTGSSSNPNLLRILPPLSVNEQEVNYFIEQLKLNLS